MTKLSPLTRKIIAVTLLIVAIALPYRLIVSPLQERSAAYAEQIAARQDVLSRLRRLADSRPQLRERLEKLQSLPSSQEGYLSGDSETLVAADLQTLVRTIVERNGGKLESTQILPATSEGAFRRVTLRVRMSSDTDSLFHTLYDLESMLPYLFLDGLDIVARNRRGRAASKASAPASELGVSYDVYGYMRAS
ncbi:MAG: hypothetical protein IPK66_09735 [Rhodospirillales bacterium]|nr:hypothetical protein [Rhodospirillales bacterium]